MDAVVGRKSKQGSTEIPLSVKLQDSDTKEHEHILKNGVIIYVKAEEHLQALREVIEDPKFTSIWTGDGFVKIPEDNYTRIPMRSD